MKNLVLAAIVALPSLAMAEEIPVLDKVEKVATCAILADQFDNEEMSKENLKKFRKMKNIPFFITDDALLAMGHRFLDEEGYTTTARINVYLNECITEPSYDPDFFVKKNLNLNLNLNRK